MPCDTQAREATEKRKREEALKALSARLASKTAKIVRTGNRISIEGWTERGGWCDECAIRALKMSNDFIAKQAIAQAAPAGMILTYGHGH